MMPLIPENGSELIAEVRRGKLETEHDRDLFTYGLLAVLSQRVDRETLEVLAADVLRDLRPFSSTSPART